MRRLAFKKRYIEPILDGSKTSTLRVRTPLADGEDFALGCSYGDPPFAYARVARVREVTRAELTEQIAVAEGFADLDELLAVLDDLYPGAERFVQVEFALA